jgi:hypothetical protein
MATGRWDVCTSIGSAARWARLKNTVAALYLPPEPALPSPEPTLGNPLEAI